MSYDDFCRCTPFEFSAIADWWNKHEDTQNQRSWEQTRYIMMVALQPYSKKKLKLTDILKFKWDKKNPPKPVEKSTRDRMEAVKARLKKR